MEQIAMKDNIYFTLSHRKLFCMFLFYFLFRLTGEAAAPSRAVPYAESLCNTNPNVFFCEDFQDQSTAPTPSTPNGYCNGTWRNPALVYSSYCYNGGSLVDPTVTIPGSVSLANKVIRLPIIGGGGGNAIDGFLGRNGVGKTYTDYYIRYQFYYSSAVTWPVDLDLKQMLSHPEVFLDPPSANYQNGVFLHQDYYCPGVGNFGDVPVLRYGPAYNQFPQYDEYCPPLSPGLPANGINAPRIVKNRWYTVEVHFRLGTTSSTGLMEAWLDGNLMYRENRANCTGSCPPMAYFYFTSYKGSGESGGGYVEYDNVVMSTSYIGPPNANSQDITPPSPPRGVSVTQQ